MLGLFGSNSPLVYNQKGAERNSLNTSLSGISKEETSPFFDVCKVEFCLLSIVIS